MSQLQTIETEVGQRALFDYGQLDTETRIVVQQRTQEIKQIVKHVASELVEIGGKIAEVKERLKNGAKFKSWLDAEFPRWSERTAHNLVYAWKEYHNADFAIDGIAPSALYLLSAPKTPKVAREMARQIVEQGEEVSHSTAKELVRQAEALEPKQAELVEEPEEAEADEASEEAGDGFHPGFPPGFDVKRAEQGLAQIGADEAVDPSAICLCSCEAGDHTREDGGFAECTKCDCEIFQAATQEEIAAREAAEEALGMMPAISKRAAPVESPAAPKSAAKPVVPERPSAWFKNRIEINITLMPCDGPNSQRKVLHSVRAGDDTPFVGMSTDETDALDLLLPMKTCELLAKLTESLAKKPAPKASAKPTLKSKPAAKKPAAKSTKKGGKK